ncbi:hypothetical protein R5W23_004833 [Gemmata sp. JC673]|uniref:Uncharacterized protein n=1 Tax=Gemmata algarum TaxID=2975278 RepID=A0ABU5F704_9BACT|nr:hypothetical protein [Gemmata algarum]MDY3563332.1 hypothetical protein [Gemmata algarum]
MSEPYIALQVVMMPKDAYGHSSFGTLPNGGQYTLYSTNFR